MSDLTIKEALLKTTQATKEYVDNKISVFATEDYVDEKLLSVDYNDLINKPFYSYEGEVYIFGPDTSYYTGAAGMYNYFNVHLVLENGKEYKVFVNDVEYSCVALVDDYNMSLEIPYVVFIESDPYSDSIKITIGGNTDYYTVAIQEIQTVYKTLDNNYIDGYVIKKGVGQNSEVFNNMPQSCAVGTSSHAEGCSEKDPNEVIPNGIGAGVDEYIISENWNKDFSFVQGEASHIEGKNNVALGSFHHAEGENNFIDAYDSSHVEGANNSVTSSNSHAEGAGNQVSGSSSHAEGAGNRASGSSSHVEGEGNLAYGDFQHVQGKYNIPDNDDLYAHIVGNGHYNYEITDSIRSNAHTLDWYGNAWYQGNITVGPDKKMLVTADYVDESFMKVRDYVVLRDQETGFEYQLSLCGGELVTSLVTIKNIEITSMPTKTQYYDGDAFVPDGLEIKVTFANDSTLVVNDLSTISFDTYNVSMHRPVVVGTYHGYQFDININVVEFDPSVVLYDFAYTDNGDGTYTITDWTRRSTGVLNVPDNNKIII